MGLPKNVKKMQDVGKATYVNNLDWARVADWHQQK